MSALSSCRDVISDAAWSVIGPLLPEWKGVGRPVADRRLIVGLCMEVPYWGAVAGSTGAVRAVKHRVQELRPVGEDGTWARLLSRVQSLADAAGDIDPVTSIDSKIVRVHQHGATLSRVSGGILELQEKLGTEPPDHAIGRSQGGLTCKVHLVCDGRGWILTAVLTGGNIADTSLLAETMDDIRLPRLGSGRPRARPDRVLADKGYPSRTNRAWLAERSIKATIPDRADMRRHRARRGSAGGRPPAFDKAIYRGRNVVERCSTSSSTGAASQCDPTRPHATTGPRSASQPHSNGSAPGPAVHLHVDSCIPSASDEMQLQPTTPEEATRKACRVYQTLGLGEGMGLPERHRKPRVIEDPARLDQACLVATGVIAVHRVTISNWSVRPLVQVDSREAFCRPAAAEVNIT